MTIAVVGTGNIGGRLAVAWARAGHSVRLGTRTIEDEKINALIAQYPSLISAHLPADAVSKAEVVLVAVPASAAFTVVQSLGDLSGKIIIDAMNAVFRKPEPFERTSQAIQQASGSTRIVKAFNTIGAENMDNPWYGDQVADMFIAGDHPEDRVVVQKLAEDIGFNVYDIGGLERETVMEQMALFWGALAFGAGLGRNIAFKVLIR